MEKHCPTIITILLFQFQTVTLNESIYCECRGSKIFTCLGDLESKTTPNVKENDFNLRHHCPEVRSLKLFKFKRNQIEQFLQSSNLSQIVSLKIAQSDDFHQDKKTFKNAKNVKNLVLSAINLQTLNPNIFEDTQNLGKLSIFGNNITKLFKHNFKYTR